LGAGLKDGGREMPIRKYTGDGHFDPETLDTMSAVFEAVLSKLGLTDKTDPKAEIIAKNIVGLVRSGEVDPTRLRDITLERLKQLSPR
jgi:hypothetical protein